MKLSDRSKVILLSIISISSLLRIIWIDKYPQSLYTDEIDQGYNAYSIMLTGSDEHGAYLPISIRSFGDWKPPLPTYLTIPFIYLFGLTETSIRLPSAILGIATVMLTFYLILELFAECKYKVKFALLGSFFLTISPWHILQSRASMLVAIALFFLEAGIYYFLRGLKKGKYLILSALLFSLSIYAYYGLRVITPLIIFLLIIIFLKNILKFKKEIIISILLIIFMMVPIIVNFIKEPDVVFGRARTVSIFYDQGVKLRQWELITQDGMEYNPLLSRFFHNNVYMYGLSILRHFMSHLEGNYLFFIGDTSSPFQIPNMGILYLIDSVFILFGISFFMEKRSQSRILLISWFIISLIPASLTFMTPSSNRTFNAIIPIIALISLGTVRLLSFKTNKYLLGSIVTLLYVVSFGYFLKQYFIVLPYEHADWWNYGWRETVKYVASNEKRFDNIIISDVNGMPYIYFLFYNKIDPLLFQKTAVRTYLSDRFGFEHVESFGKYIFAKDLDWQYTKDNMLPKTLYIIPASQVGFQDKGPNSISYPNGKDVIKFFENDKETL